MSFGSLTRTTEDRSQLDHRSVAQALDHTRPAIRPATEHSYQSHITLYLLPHLAHYRLGQVTARQLTETFAALAMQQNRYAEPLAGSALHRVKANLRAAFNAAIRRTRNGQSRHARTPTGCTPSGT